MRKMPNIESAGKIEIWWLRLPGYSSNASCVDYGGSVDGYGNSVDYFTYGARPALHLNLKASSDAISASSWSYAGTVISDSKVEETGAPKPTVTPSPEPGSIGKVSALKLKQKKGTVTASWKKTAGAKGYQVCYSTSRKWKNKKKKLVSKNKAVVAVNNLKKKKTYYFRVRGYRLEGKKKVYGAWSGTKKIKIKK